MRTRVWRLPPQELELDVPLLIADGHHRYETAVAFREEDPTATHTFAVLVSIALARARDLPDAPRRSAISTAEPTAIDDVDLGSRRRSRSTAAATSSGSTSDDELDARAVERYAPRGRRATRRTRDEAIAAVDRGEAEAAFLVRAPTVAQVAEFADARRDDAAEVDVLLPQAHLRSAPVPASMSPLARALPRRGRRREGRARAMPDARRARARRRPGRGRRHDRRARRGSRDGDAAALRPRRTSASSPRRSGSRARAATRSRRPDRRLAERRARHPVLLPLGRGRRGRHDRRRLLRLRLRLRRERGVDGRARRRRASERRAARPRAPKDYIEFLSLEATRGDARPRERCVVLAPLTDRVRVMGAQAITLLPPRRRPHRRGRLPEAVARRSTSPPRSCSCASAASRSSCSTAPPLGARPLDLRARSRIVAAGNDRAVPAARDSAHQLRVGCSGWNYDHWRHGVFYPERCPAARWLRYYAQYFDTVELNNTFYRLPRTTAVARWVAETPPDFVFTVKVSRYITHIKRLRDAAEHLPLLLDRIEPAAALAEARSAPLAAAADVPPRRRAPGRRSWLLFPQPCGTQSSFGTKAGLPMT